MHFRDCILQFQGRQNVTIDKSVYDRLESEFDKHHLLIGDKNTPNSLLYDVKINILSTNEKKFSKKTLETINSVHNISRASCNNNYNINLCFNYGGREEIINTSKKLVKKGLEINEENFTKNLLTGECPELDIMIRFGNEKRISNFLLYQLAYTELFFINKLLPEVSINDMDKILLEYTNRNIRKGK